MLHFKRRQRVAVRSGNRSMVDANTSSWLSYHRRGWALRESIDNAEAEAFVD